MNEIDNLAELASQSNNALLKISESCKSSMERNNKNGLKNSAYRVAEKNKFLADAQLNKNLTLIRAMRK